MPINSEILLKICSKACSTDALTAKLPFEVDVQPASSSRLKCVAILPCEVHDTFLTCNDQQPFCGPVCINAIESPQILHTH